MCVSKVIGRDDVVSGLNRLMRAVWALPAVLLYSKPTHTAVLSSLLVDDNAFVQRFAATSDDGEETVLTLKFTLEVGPGRYCSPSHPTHFESSVLELHGVP